MSRDRTWQEVRDPDTNMSFIENNKHTQPIERSRERESGTKTDSRKEMKVYKYTFAVLTISVKLSRMDLMSSFSLLL